MVRAGQALAKDLQVRVFRRDRWLCTLCGRPVVFPPAMRQLEHLAQIGGWPTALAYYDPRWRRDRAPLLDHLGAVVDHREAFARGGAHDESNFVTACNKCNARKTSASVDDFSARAPAHRVKSKYGEPTDWDGLSAVFVVLARTDVPSLTATEAEWLSALEEDVSASLRRPIRPEIDPDRPLLPARTARLVEAIRSMLPQPVVGEAILVAGDPPEVIVEVTSERIDVLTYSAEWIENHEPTTFGTLVASFDAATVDPPSIVRAIMHARARRIATFSWCPKCSFVQPPEWMTEHGCMTCCEAAGMLF